MIQRTRPNRRPLRPAVSDEGRAAPDQGRQHPAAPSGPGLAWLILMVAVGSILAITGIGLIMSVILIVIGLPMFIVGLALVETALTWRRRS